MEPHRLELKIDKIITGHAFKYESRFPILGRLIQSSYLKEMYLFIQKDILIRAIFICQ